MSERTIKPLRKNPGKRMSIELLIEEHSVHDPDIVGIDELTELIEQLLLLGRRRARRSSTSSTSACHQ